MLTSILFLQNFIMESYFVDLVFIIRPFSVCVIFLLLQKWRSNQCFFIVQRYHQCWRTVSLSNFSRKSHFNNRKKMFITRLAVNHGTLLTDKEDFWLRSNLQTNVASFFFRYIQCYTASQTPPYQKISSTIRVLGGTLEYLVVVERFEADIKIASYLQ